MAILLPAEGLIPQDVIGMLSEEGTWETWSSQFQYIRTNLRIPKFKFSYKNLLNDELSQLGMQIAFTNQADFTGINSGGGLFISEIKQKSFIEVNEEGTEAAAVTSVGIGLVSFTPPVSSLTIDRPFIFLIREMSTGLILFIGQVNDPSAETNTES